MTVYNIYSLYREVLMYAQTPIPQGLAQYSYLVELVLGSGTEMKIFHKFLTRSFKTLLLNKRFTSKIQAT